MSRSIRFRRSPHLVCYWDGTAFVVHEYACRQRSVGTAYLAAVLNACDQWSSLAEIIGRCPAIPSATVRGLVEQLSRFGMLDRSNRPRPASQRQMNRLAPWNPAGGFFHAATKDVTFGERELAERMLRERASSRRIPAMVKRYPRSTRIPLPRASGSGEFVGTLLTRRTWRRFSTRKLTTGQLATLLALTGGFQQYVKGGPLGRSPQRTSPSGGARHPIEIYVLAVNVEGLPKGLYHYGSDAHVLHRIRPARAGGVQRYLPSQYWFDNAAAVVFFSGVFERTLWRYDTARAYRAVLIEAGHLCQTFCLTATWLNLAPFCSMAIADQAIETDLGLDGITESVLYAAGVGCRDGDASDSFSPRDVPPPRIEANPAFRALAPSRAGKLRGSR